MHGAVDSKPCGAVCQELGHRTKRFRMHQQLNCRIRNLEALQSIDQAGRWEHHVSDQRNLRFFAFAQFKRSALPNGPKVSAGGSLSPRSDWRAPSDAQADAWLRELRENVPPARQ